MSAALDRELDRVPLALVGCGFMGRRHLSGYGALRRATQWRGELAAVVDLDAGAAAALAEEAEQLLGHRPRVVTDVTDLYDGNEVVALDVVTDPRSHHAVVAPALRAGLHVLCEKPLGLTAAACRTMLDAARESGAVLATAENYRRGGANRVARAVLDTGLLGRVNLMLQLSLGGDDSVMISPWRHHRTSGSIALDMCVHYADLVEYFLGPVETVWGRGLIAEPQRRVVATGEVVHATGEDSVLAVLRTRGGVDVHLCYLPSGPGHRWSQRSLHGTAGSMLVPGDRVAGAQVQVMSAAGTLAGPALAEALGPAAVLDDVTTALLGPDGTGRQGAAFADVDAGYIGVEVADFLDAVQRGRPPEVDGLGGARAVAVVLAAMESGTTGQPVAVADVLTGSVNDYQREIDGSLGLLAEKMA